MGIACHLDLVFGKRTASPRRRGSRTQLLVPATPRFVPLSPERDKEAAEAMGWLIAGRQARRSVRDKQDQAPEGPEHAADQRTRSFALRHVRPCRKDR
ncbi:hypothetical protein Sm713_31570 [Streptomyces sp. TS71-3]|nr:hypothetical protein Sm713_31570 [Streptomyces sp. TS71-3]